MPNEEFELIKRRFDGMLSSVVSEENPELRSARRKMIEMAESFALERTLDAMGPVVMVPCGDCMRWRDAAAAPDVDEGRKSYFLDRIKYCQCGGLGMAPSLLDSDAVKRVEQVQSDAVQKLNAALGSDLDHRMVKPPSTETVH